MHFFQPSVLSFGLLATSSLVAGHSAIIAATGDQGGAGSAIGVDPNTPRDGTRRNPFQQDATRFRGAAADSCGETLAGGTNNIETGTRQVMAQNGATLPQVSPGGSIQMTVHQVNADGAGPYTCMIDATGTGTNWVNMQVTTNIAGSERGRNRETNTQDLPLTAAIPANMQCTGTVAGQQNVCMVRCQNPARAGPFGGCVPVQMAAPANNANNAVNNNAGNAANNAGNAANNAGNAANNAGNAANNAGNAVNAGNAAANAGNAVNNAGKAANNAATNAANAIEDEEAVGNNIKRSPKQTADGATVTDDDEEEEVELTQRLRRWIPASARK